MRIWFDTESIQFVGATMMLQYAKESKPNDIILYDIFDKPAVETLELINDFTQHTLVGYNLAHEGFHFARTFNCLMQLPLYQNPDPYEYSLVEQELSTKKYCIKPKGLVDLMIIGRRGAFQSTMKQHPIIIRKIPKTLAQELIHHLDKLEIPSIYFAKDKKHVEGETRWKIQPLDAENGMPLSSNEVKAGRPVDEHLVNLKLSFRPSAKLKDVCKYILGFTDTEEFELQARKYEELGWYPCSGEWINVFPEHYAIWKYNTSKREYARRDVVYTKAIDDYLGRPEPDEDSTLAFLTGNNYWSGFALDLVELEKRKKRLEGEILRRENRIKIKVNSPQQVLKYLHEACHPIEKIAVKSTKKDILRVLCDSENKSLAHRARMIVETRNKKYEYTMLKRLSYCKRLYVTFNMAGTRTHRATGSDSINKQKQTINPQGIKKGEIRKIFTFADPGQILSGGDFSGFEVSIYDAVYKDPKLHEELLSNKKIHAIWGSFLYEMTYDEVLATDGIKASEPNGFYQRSKNSFFAALYGAQQDKIAEVTWLTIEQVLRAYQHFEDTYTAVKRSKAQLVQDFSCIAQTRQYGKVEWVEPKKFITSFMNFTRSFEFEFDIIKQIFAIASDLPKDIIQAGKNIGIIRGNERVQSGSGAIRSALFGACGNLMGKVQRIAGNFEIQSPGADITKKMQYELSQFQPVGIHEFQVKLFNMHDELRVAHVESLTIPIKDKVNDFIMRYRSRVPLLAMKWVTNQDSWFEKKQLNNVKLSLPVKDSL